MLYNTKVLYAMSINKVAPATDGFSGLVHNAEDKQGVTDPRLECEDVPLYDDNQVMDKLMSIINQLGDLQALKLGEKEAENKDKEEGENAAASGGKFVMSSNINKAIQRMINDINEKGYIIHPNGRFKMIWDTVMAM
jgi:hypothetical protein